MKKNKKILLGTTAITALAIVPTSVVISCGTNDGIYHLEGKTFNNKNDLINYAKKQLNTKQIKTSDKRIWKISNGGYNQYFSSPLELRKYIFKNKITEEKMFVPNKYKFSTKEKIFNILNDEEISNFTKSLKGTYYAFRISGGKKILSKPLTGNSREDKIIYNETKEKAINSFLQIHQIYRYDNLYFPNKDSLQEYLKKEPLNSVKTNNIEAFVFKSDFTNASSSLFHDVHIKNSDDRRRAMNFIKDNSEIGMEIKGVNNKTQFKNIDEILNEQTFNKESLLRNINYLKVNKTKKRFLVDIKKEVNGTLIGDYVISSNGQVSRVEKPETEWKGTEEKFDMQSFRNKNIETALNVASDLMFYNEGSSRINILDNISTPSYLLKNTKKDQEEFFNFKNKLNSYSTQMNKGLGDALWNLQENLAEGKRFSSFKSIFYLRTWLMDKIVMNNIADPSLISLVNRFFNNGLKLLTQKFREIILPIAGIEVVKNFDLTKIVDFNKQKNMYIDPEVILSSFYNGRYQIPGTNKEIYNENLILVAKSLQIYLATEGYKSEQTETIKKAIKSNKENRNGNMGSVREVVIPEYDFINYRNSEAKSLIALRKVIDNDWITNSNFSIKKQTKQKFISQTELFLKRTQKQFELANKHINAKKDNSKSFEWGLKELNEVISNLQNLTQIDQIEILKNNGGVMLPTVFNDLMSNSQNAISLALQGIDDLKQLDFNGINKDVLNGLSIAKQITSNIKEAKELIETLKEHYVMAKQIKKIFSEDIKNIKKSFKVIKSAKDAINVVKKTYKTAKDIKNAADKLKQISAMSKILTAAPSPWGMVASLAFDVVLDIAAGIIGEQKIDGFKFEYGDNRSENIIWTGGKHTDHEIFGFISWKSDEVDLKSLKMISTVDLTNIYENDIYKYNGRTYKSIKNLIADWLNELKYKYKIGELSKQVMKEAGIIFRFNAAKNSDIDKLAEEVVDNAKLEKYAKDKNDEIIKDRSSLKQEKIDKILNLVKPIWVAQLPKIITKGHISNYENSTYAMPITKKIKLYKHENENIDSKNNYLIIDPNSGNYDDEKIKKMLILENVEKEFIKLFDDSLIKSKQISLKDAISDKEFDGLSNGFIRHSIYTIKNNDGQVEKFLDENDAIDWLLSKSNYNNTEIGGDKLIYVYKDKEFISITEFIEYILKNQNKSRRQNEEEIYKKAN